MKQEENLYHITNLQKPSQKKQGKYQLSKYYLLEQLVIYQKEISFTPNIFSLLCIVYRRLRYGITNNPDQQKCPSLTPKCDPDSKIRTYDGTCNNLQFPERGAMSKPYKRFFKPMYEDGKLYLLISSVV